MGFLHNLWDDTLAGPAPDSGLGNLRKYNSFSAARLAATANPDHRDDCDVPVTRTITILRRANSTTTRDVHRHLSPDSSGSVPSSPTGSATPRSPFSPSTPHGDYKKFTGRKSTTDRSAGPGSPTGYDWIVLSALDR